MSYVRQGRQGRRRFRRTSALVMFIAATVAAAAAIVPASQTTAGALPASDLPPIGADAGRFTLPVDCAITLPDFFNFHILSLQASVDIQGVAPTVLGPGQQFYLTEGSGALTMPMWLTSLGALFGVNSADATVREMNIGAVNATPSAINIAPTPVQINNIPLKFGELLTVRLPLDPGATFPDIGPYTAPSDGIVTLKFAGAVVDVLLKGPFGIQVRARANCKGVQGNALLSMSVGGPSGQPPLAIHDAPLNFPPVDTNEQVGIIHGPYRCEILGTQYNAGIAVGGQLPLSVNRSTGLKFTDASGALTVPPDTVNSLIDLGFSAVEGTVNSLNLDIENGVPARQNVIPPSGLPIPHTALVRDQALTVPLPVSGTLTAGPYLPSVGADHMVVTMGTASATLSFTGADGPVDATCAAPSPKVILYDAPVV